MTKLARLTTNEAREAVREAKFAVIATGAIEQHGPHLDLQCDWAIASAMADRLEAEFGDEALLVPGLPYGCSEHHTGFAGTMSVSGETFIALLTDVALTLKAQGISKVIVVNGHGGNMDPIKLAARALRRDHAVLMAHAMWIDLASDIIADIMRGKNLYNHACEIETSIALELSPEIVREIPDELGWRALGTALSDPPNQWVYLPTWFHEWTSDGALGDPREASVERGKQIVNAATQRLFEFARSFVAMPIPEGS